MRFIDWSSDVCSADLRVEIAAAGGTAAGIDVGGVHRLGLAENDRAAGRQLDPAGTRMGDVVLDVEQREQPGRIVEAFQPADMVGRMFEQPGARLGKTGRSEERRVGKESASKCRFPWSAHHLKKQKKTK